METRTDSRNHTSCEGRDIVICSREDFSTDRPPCPECGHTKTISRGTEWHCPNCERRWKKKYRRKLRK